MAAVDIQKTQSKISKRFIEVNGRLTHYRVAGRGPAVVLLHDSPRSSRLHLQTLAALAEEFTVFALDTPGYGLSEPLLKESLTIGDFAEALASSLSALGLEQAPLYATHTSAKIAVEYAHRYPRMPLLVLDGLSLPETLAPEAFIERYMRPFAAEASGGFLASEWSRTRDMLRWFPWFDTRAANRFSLEVSDHWIHDYAIDLFDAGSHYSDAYAAAMRYLALPVLSALQVPTVVAAKADDVLFGFLDKVPVADNPNLQVQRLGKDRDEWLTWMSKTLAAGVTQTEPVVTKLAAPMSQRRCYIDLDDGGQLLVDRIFGEGERPLLILGGPTRLRAAAWRDLLSGKRHLLLPQLPGFGESDALVEPSLDQYLNMLETLLNRCELRQVDILATEMSCGLALALAARLPDRIDRLVLDGVASVDALDGIDQLADLTPTFTFDGAGAHLHQIWHMLRDSECHWPWFDRGDQAMRTHEPLLDAEHLFEALRGIHKQPAKYGDMAKASVAAFSATTLENIVQKVLVLNNSQDPLYAGAEKLAEAIVAGELEKPVPDVAARVDGVIGFLSKAE